jgi:hypothetical protein
LGLAFGLAPFWEKGIIMAYQRNTLQPDDDADSSMATTLWVDTYFVKLKGSTLDSGATIRTDTDPVLPTELGRKNYIDNRDVNNRRFSFFWA